MTQPSFDETRQRAAKDHLWMHFTRHSTFDKQEVPTIVRGDGVHIFDSHGNRYLDGLAGLFVVQVGHGRTELAEAAAKNRQPSPRSSRSGPTHTPGPSTWRSGWPLCVAMTVIGPRTDRSPAFGRRLDALLAAENVHWMGQLAADDLPGQLAKYGAGITPYADSHFNRASFPLKTLEYLAAGLGVVSTDMPSARWLNTRLISLRSDPREFALAVKAAVAQRNDPEQERRRKQFAAEHTWAERAIEFQRLLDLADHHRTGPCAAATVSESGEEPA